MEAKQSRQDANKPGKFTAEMFLDACMNDENIDLIKKYAKKFAKTLEKRQDRKYIKGFGGIHYAAYYGCEEAFKALLPYSARLLTGEDVHIAFESPSLRGRIYFFNLASCSTIIHVMAASPFNDEKCDQNRQIKNNLNAFFSELEKQDSDTGYAKNGSRLFELIGSQNSLGQNATHVSLLTGYLNEWWRNEFVFRRELFQTTKDGLTTTMLATFMSRNAFMRQLQDCYQMNLLQGQQIKKKDKLPLETQRLVLQNLQIIRLLLQAEEDGCTVRTALEDQFHVQDIGGGNENARQDCRGIINKIIGDAQNLLSQLP